MSKAEHGTVAATDGAVAAERRQETVADIVAEMNCVPGDMYDSTITMTEEHFREYADRIEAAHVRELQAVQETAENALCKADEAETCRKLMLRLRGIVNHLPPAVTGSALMLAEVEGAERLDKANLVSVGYKRLADLMRETYAVAKEEEE